MPPPSHPAPLAPGTALANYVLGRCVGSGAMGTVYEAHDTSLDRTVAVKVVNPDLADDPATAARFLREARAAARVSNPNLAHVYFVSADPACPFYAMEFVEGENLEDRVRRAGPLPFAEAVAALLEAARGLDAAHRAGVVHRDVKPSNLLRQPDGHVKVTDFGLAKSSFAGDAHATHAGQVTGTPTYMSPEQCRGGAVDARTDVYSLGLTAWFLLVGRPAFEGPSLGALLDQQMNAPLPSAVAARPDLPDAVDRVLARFCAKNPESRPASMGEVVELLDGLSPRPVVRAALATRAVATVVDFLLFALVLGALSYVVTRLEGWTRPTPAFWFVEGIVAGLLAIALQWAMEVRHGASLGKMLFGLVVRASDGTAASRRALAVRFLLRFPSIPSAFLPDEVPLLRWAHLGFAALQVLAVLLGVLWHVTRGRTFSDAVTGTVVAYREGARAPTASPA